MERVAGESRQQDLAQLDLVSGDTGAKSRRGDIEAEQSNKKIAHGVELIQHRIAQVEVAHRAEAAGLTVARALETAKKTRLPLEHRSQRLAIRRIEIGNLARPRAPEPHPRHHLFGARAQVDREADPEPEQQLQMSCAQMLDRGFELSARQMLQREIKII